MPRYRENKEKMKHPENITKEQLVRVIDEVIILHTHAERNRNILKRRLIDGLTHEQLAEEFDLSTKAIQKILYKYEAMVFSHFS